MLRILIFLKSTCYGINMATLVLFYCLYGLAFSNFYFKLKYSLYLIQVSCTVFVVWTYLIQCSSLIAVFIPLIFLLRNNSHTNFYKSVRFNFFFFLVYLRSWATITTFQYQNIFITPKRNHRPKSSHSHFPFPSPETLVYFPVSMDMPILDISYKWDHKICEILSLPFLFSIVFSRSPIL